MTKQVFLSQLLAQMSVVEKAGQLNLLTGTMDATGLTRSTDLATQIRAGHCGAVLNVYTPAATRALQELALASPLQIPLIFGYDVIHGHRTIFPIPLGLSCSWNPSLLERCARAAASEAAADGLHWVYSPMVDISQDPRWGRVAEGAGEDPWLGSQLAAAMVRGYQGNDLADPASVIACVKHFALYGAPIGGRDYNTVDMSRRAMEETYFPPYRAAIAAGARTVMTAFNEIEGIPASGNHWLLNDLLRTAWGFQGWIVSDYTAVTEMMNHGTAANRADAAEQSFTAGVDMDMVAEAFIDELPKLVESGAISPAQLDTAVLRILETKWDLGLFQEPFARSDEARAKQVHLSAAHRQLAREAAREAIVLLKNTENLLPLDPGLTVALIGPLADSRRDMLGSWIAAGDEAVTASPLTGIQENSTVIFAKGCEIHSENQALLTAASHAAAQADVVILVLGESWQMSGEAASRVSIRLPKCQRKLAKYILKIGKPCILVTLSGRPLELTWEHSKFTTILHGWQLGTEGGHALADVIFGHFPPVGKLTMGFPRSVGQLPMTYREKPTGRPYDSATAYSSRYLDSENSALYPFGHGLTYGSLEIGIPFINSPNIPWGEVVTVSVEIRNPCTHSVTDTLQLYLRDLVASVSRPVKELRGYHRLTLAAGETRIITFTLTAVDLSFPSRDFQPIVEPGEFEVMIGTNSCDLTSVRFFLLNREN